MVLEDLPVARCSGRASPPRPLNAERGEGFCVSPEQLPQTRHVVHQIHHPALHLGTRQSDGAYNLPTPRGRCPEDVLYPRTDLGLHPVGLHLLPGQWITACAFFTDPDVNSVLGKPAFARL